MYVCMQAVYVCTPMTVFAVSDFDGVVIADPAVVDRCTG